MDDLRTAAEKFPRGVRVRHRNEWSPDPAYGRAIDAMWYAQQDGARPGRRERFRTDGTAFEARTGVYVCVLWDETLRGGSVGLGSQTPENIEVVPEDER